MSHFCGTPECTRNHDNWNCILCDDKFDKAERLIEHLKLIHKLEKGRAVMYDHKLGYPAIITKNQELAEEIRLGLYR